jgi:CBS domain-containing protein
MTDPARGLTSGVYTVTPHANVRQAAELMHAQGVGDVIVVEHLRPVGILTDRDIVIRVAAAGLNPRDVSVQEVMSSPLITAVEEGEVADAIALMQRHGIRRLPILDQEGRLCSILTLDDLLMLGIGQQQLGDIIRRQLRGIQPESRPAEATSASHEVRRPTAAAIATIARAGVAPPLGKHKTWLSPATHRILRRNRQWFILVAVLSLLAAAIALILGYVLTPAYLE